MHVDEKEEEKMERINKQYEECLQKFIGWIQYFQENSAFRGLKKIRYAEYRKFEKLKKDRESEGKNLIAAMFKNVKKHQNNLFAFMGGANESKAVAQEEDQHEGKSIAIVTFKSSTTKDAITKYNTMNLV